MCRENHEQQKTDEEIFPDREGLILFYTRYSTRPFQTERLFDFRTMDIQLMINEIRSDLEENFAAVDSWFDEPSATRSFRPRDGAWSIDEVLEHISLTNHYLLILVEKGTQKALKRAQTENLEEALRNYEFQRGKLTEIGIHKSFAWMRPEHMEPRGEKTSEGVHRILKSQLKQCLDTLDLLRNGEGVLCETTMTVNDLGKIDVYEYLYFISQHARRHITQMEKNKNAFADK